MPGYSSSQKQLIAQFVAFSSAKESVAAKYLKNNGWNVERAVDDYFQNNPSASQAMVSALNKIFDSYRDSPADNPDGIGIEGAMKYLGDIKVQLDEVVCLAISELLRSPSMGEFTRESFIDGWKDSGSDTLAKQASFASNLRKRIRNEPDLFKRVYRYAFILCRLPGQRHLTLEIATEQWRLFFTADNGGISWNTSTTPWLDWWLEFVEGSWKRPINKDLWEQTEVLMRKTLEDPSLKWWSPDGAWPGAVDDFIVFAKGKLGQNSSSEAMDVE
ncbi:Scaffold-type E3 ligase [Coccidioides immitis]|uniref:Defective in cullin neddylation protein n=2 Tax=Coccidioides immitis TaxID=5501 RepID=A0A0J8QZP2_COCIT|nr:defective in cullin neddylation protein 1 [Coccidioides immitis RMSCC 2394]KMU77956.1 defective in cullin neddylation protein 1 [Coccidioides immitis RMSCC 3703]TPX20860.1 Scaffold-type E3 ligase [Coccidioides immitis]